MSPQQFDQCVKKNGRVRTMPVKGNRYMHVCFLDGKSFAGEVKSRKEKK